MAKQYAPLRCCVPHGGGVGTQCQWPDRILRLLGKKPISNKTTQQNNIRNPSAISLKKDPHCPPYSPMPMGKFCLLFRRMKLQTW